MSNDIHLTRDAMRLALAMVRHYKQRIKLGVSRSDARFLGGPNQVIRLVPDFSIPDIADLVWELESVGFVSVLPGDDLFSECALMPLCIAWADNLPFDVISGALDALGKFL